MDTIPVTTDNGFTATNDLTTFLNVLNEGKYSSDPGQTIPLVHGTGSNNQEVSSFTTDSLSTENFATVVINSDTSPSGFPTQIFIKDSKSPNPVNIDSSKFRNLTDSPKNLQIFYDGPGTVNIAVHAESDKGFNGLVYAPNATVNINGGGPNSQFNGAVVGRTTNIRMSGDMNLLPNADSGSAGQNSSLVTPGYRASTFQQINGKLVE